MAPLSEALDGAGLSEPKYQGHLCRILRILGGADLSFARCLKATPTRFRSSRSMGRASKPTDLRTMCKEAN